ncbi:MAG: hypothetical protein LC797_23930, partial [Chloroflexi bacterium]|nr:hypothetical protein [Chloroflexota bacterium]
MTTGRRVWVNLYGRTSPGEFEVANTDVLADTGDDRRRNGHAEFGKVLRTPQGNVEVGVAIPIGCMVPLAIAAAALVGAGVLAGTRLQAATAS